MNVWDEEYRKRLVSIEEAVMKIRSDDDVVVAQCASEPQGCMSKFHLASDRVRMCGCFRCSPSNPTTST